jgi:hypothetical protein
MLLRKLKEMEGPMPRGDQLSRQWRLIQLIDRPQGITVDLTLLSLLASRA